MTGKAGARLSEKKSSDIYSRAKRSEIMGRVRGMDTAPELRLRSFLHRLGYRFRLHRKDLPGRPDIVLPRFRTVVFMHGCFWHSHPACKKATVPIQNREMWQHKIARNVERDREDSYALLKIGWKVIVVWECELKQRAVLIEKLSEGLPDLKARIQFGSWQGKSN